MYNRERFIVDNEIWKGLNTPTLQEEISKASAAKKRERKRILIC